MTTPLKESQASCNLDRGSTETRCVEGVSEEQRRLAQAVHETWSDRAPQVIADRDARRDARLLASTIPASAVRALVEQLERDVAHYEKAATAELAQLGIDPSELHPGDPAPESELYAWGITHALKTIRGLLLPKPEEKTE